MKKHLGSDFNINDEIDEREREREIGEREKIIEKIDETEELRRKRETDLENLFDIDDGALDLLMELDIDKKDRQEELILIEIKLEKLKISEKTIRVIRSQYLD